MDWIPLIRSSTSISVDRFWHAIVIYLERPHLVNRKLAHASPLVLAEITPCDRSAKLFTREALLYEIRKLRNLADANIEFLRSVVGVTFCEAPWESCLTSSKGKFVSVRLLLGRKNEKCLEVVVMDKEAKSVTFHAVQETDSPKIAPEYPYHVQLMEDNLVIACDSYDDAEKSSAQWICSHLFERLLKWTEVMPDKNIMRSLSLLEAPMYCAVYNDLKRKYAPKLVESWYEVTKTDPQKYVFEDLAITSYLICLWKQQAEEVIFVDCGCGNGLLVYILNQEGYKGWGVDVRARSVWETYSGKADLRVEVVTPSSEFPEATWIIGNHSDELTPWIPVIALKSSSNYFVLPCCPYDFSGQKYSRLNTKVSQYQDYLHYVEGISTRCGFKTSIDRLRISSTKRACLVGVRDSSDINVQQYKDRITEFIKSRTGGKFKARAPQEIVKNCTHLPEDLIKKIVSSVVKLLLGETFLVKKDDGGDWNQGGKLTLAQLIEGVASSDLKSLKSQCGGFQTLLKNHRYIFRLEDGTVAIRAPATFKDTSRYKDKPCWFLKNHPDGCLHEAQTCAYRH